MDGKKFSKPEIVLLGDLASHIMLERNPGKDNDEPPHYPNFRRQHEPLLPEMIAEALADGRTRFDKQRVTWHRPERVNAGIDPLDGCEQCISVLELFSPGSRKGENVSVLRVKKEYLASAYQAGECDSKYFLDSIQAGLGHAREEGNYRIAVIYDQNGSTREAIRTLGNDKIGALRETIGHHKLVICITNDVLKWVKSLEFLDEHVFGRVPKLAQETSGIDTPDPTISYRHKRPSITIQIAADTLRKAGINITKYGALEDSIRDISQATRQPPLSDLLAFADDLIILFRETGSLHIKKMNTVGYAASIHYCPNFDRIAQANPGTYGKVPGKSAVFLTAVIKGLYTSAEKGDPEPELGGALRLGAVAFNRHFAKGLQPGDPFSSIVRVLSHTQCNELAGYCENSKRREYLACSLSLDVEDMKEPTKWSRAASFLRQDEDILATKLRDIVTSSMDQVLITSEDEDTRSLRTAQRQAGLSRTPGEPWFPRSFIEVPYVTFNKLKLVDSKEIAEHYALAKIISNYIETKTWATPLSIAVFGTPGSGKSFAVQQVLASVDPMRKSAPLTFNLAQFSSVDQLTDAFHKIQDRALATDEVPLAIFDEFDAKFVDDLGWLKYFLAPMQDGLFRGKSGDYRTGRAIFLFSGGTSDNYKDFTAPLNDRTREDEIRAAKLKDFVSRLRGYLDILDLNQGLHSVGPDNRMMRLRRAVKLRALLKINAKDIMVTYSDGVEHARIGERVIDAFLNCEYVHGVRSMEAIIQMSRWIDGWFVPASLPPEDQLSIHVKDGKFLG
ncbi:hypothetical protein M3I54_33425 [Paraburkholderia sp. CNPSo 3274]|uniref:hypothetical protein n=1 Tax=Paraburkholderia sp. CNPSo 3274 TaxID=2940932 RepID=UPI0020B7A5E9|nr:hypothetical protein [Paraburkholderia sp. CNPSo 3274]MCP3711798.1 hypothetical protein [Paraburkholderia sp. CNPSo 3274]